MEIIVSARAEHDYMKIFNPVKRDLDLPRPGWNFTSAIRAGTFFHIIVINF